jgi:ABC-type Fe3+/spermidine/putrescine transport system ATPase subunit
MEARFAAEWTVVFGHSGSGKSTLLRLLAGLDRGHVDDVTARVAHNGRMLADLQSGVWLAPGRRETALVAQHPALFPHLTVQANVAYGIAGLERGERERRVEAMLALVGATELADRRPRSLSGGEAQRVALARALATGPKLLLLDEPLSALDGAAADALLDRLQTWVRENGIQAVLATHEAADAFAMGAEVALLREGRLAAQGTAEVVLAEERERIAARLGTADR